MSSSRTIDLFAGPGGWDVAARRLGLDPLGVELDDSAIYTRQAAGLRTEAIDVAALDPMPCDTLIASPPCQAFSTAGKRKGALDQKMINRCAIQLGRGRDHRHEYRDQCADPRSLLVVEPLRWALASKPVTIAWEQVPPVLPFWRLCARILERHGYHTWTGCLHAEQYGVPQTRRRAFMLASLAAPVTPPEPTHSRFYSRTPGKLDMGVMKWVSMAEALGWEDGLVGFPRRADRGESIDIDGTAYRARDLRPVDQPAFALTEKTRSWVLLTNRDQRPDGSRQERSCDLPAPSFTAKAGGQWKFLRNNSSAHASRRPVEHPAPTLFFGHAKNEVGFVNDPDDRVNRKGRAITQQEAAVLQAFPLDYPWQGTRTKQFEQIGNAVPPLFAQHVLGAVLSAAQEMRDAA